MNHCSDFNLIASVFQGKGQWVPREQKKMLAERGDNILDAVGPEISNYCLQNSEVLIEDMV